MRRDRVSVVVLLAENKHDYHHMARPLLRALEATHHFHVEVVTDQAKLAPHRGQVVVAASDHAPLPGQIAGLKDFVRRGGGLVLLHGTLATWSEGSALTEMSAWATSGPGPVTELLIRPDAGHPLTARLAPETKLHDELYLSE